jgi:Domain of unknown function (DUF4276)
VRIVLFVEGETERYLPEFLARWTEPKLANRIAIKAVNFGGVGNYMKYFAERSRLALEQSEVIAVVGLIDFYGSGLPYPDGTIHKQYAWAKHELEKQVNRPRFRQHFAVHETEAWLLSDPRIFPREVVPHLPTATTPETVNTQQPPSRRLRDLYRLRLNRTYNKPLEGSTLFRKLNPDIAYGSCPHLKLLLDELLTLSQTAAQ